MNDRLLNKPIPSRTNNPAISPQLQMVIYRALERDPKDRYATAREFAHDLEHLDEVSTDEREERHQHSPSLLSALFFGPLALIPALIFAVLFFVSRHS